MSEINAPATLTAPGPLTVSFNNYSTSAFYHFTDVAGLDQAPLRNPKEKKPNAPGGIIHKFLKDARLITISGQVVATSVSERNSMCDALIAALEAIEQADGTYTWTPTGGSLKTLTVRSDVAVLFSGGSGPTVKNFTFGLVAADPTIT